jgi:Trk K+ transport system NAD-binding subunit
VRQPPQAAARIIFNTPIAGVIFAMEAVRITRAEFVDMPLAPGSCAIGKSVAELDLPRAAVLVSIRRGQELVIPRGDTCLQAGDIVTALCEREYTAQVKAALNGVEQTGPKSDGNQ